jgi:hypothetical protein
MVQSSEAQDDPCEIDDFTQTVVLSFIPTLPNVPGPSDERVQRLKNRYTPRLSKWPNAELYLRVFSGLQGSEPKYEIVDIVKIVEGQTDWTGSSQVFTFPPISEQVSTDKDELVSLVCWYDAEN